MKRKTGTTRRIAAAAAGVTALGLILAGCGGDEDAQTAAPTATASESAGTGQMTGGSAQSGDLAVSGMWAKESSLDLAAAFGTVANSGEAGDTLVAASAVGVPEVQLHEVVDGQMQQVQGGFPIPAGGTLVLEPGGNHLMFMGLTEKIAAGSMIDITLEFASGTTITVTAPVRAFTTEQMDEFDDSHMSGDEQG